MASTKQKSIPLTPERLRELLDCDPATGIFRWRQTHGGVRQGAIAGGIKGRYSVVGIYGKAYLTHRLVWLYVHGEWPSGRLDHKDTIRDHNWIDNLRLATGTQNQANSRRRVDNKSGYKGVHPHQGRFRAMIRKNRRNVHIGSFDTPEEAHAAYVAKASELFGEFANDGHMTENPREDALLPE